MKKVVRKSVFETNSSSAHAFAFINKKNEHYSAYESKLSKVTDDFHKLMVVIASCDVNLKDSIQYFADWLMDNVDGGNKLDYRESRELAWDIMENGDEESIAEALKNNPSISDESIIEALDSDYKERCGENIYLAFIRDNWDLCTFLDYWKIRKEAKEFYIKTKGAFDKKQSEIVNLKGYRYDDCICDDFFYDGALVECNCDIESLADKIPGEYPNADALMTALFNDELSIFYMERYGSAYCYIDSYVSYKKDGDDE